MGLETSIRFLLIIFLLIPQNVGAEKPHPHPIKTFQVFK
ncbi:hypothetical protein ABIB30_001722 [Pedobacter sp. UYP1]